MSSEKRRGWSWLWGKKSEPPPTASENAKTPHTSASSARPASAKTVIAPTETRSLSITGAKVPQDQQLTLLQLKRVVRASSGELVAVDPSSIRILLAHMNTITQILLRGQLEDVGFFGRILR